MPSGATWRVGVITVPASTGTQAITGLGGTPAAVFFFGTNWLTEDTAVTSSGTGLFRGMAAAQWDSPSTIVNSSASVVPAGDAHHASQVACMNMLDSSGGLTFRYWSAVTSFDADGFTLNWSTVTAGGYKVVYAALMDVTNCGAYMGAGTTLSLGWKAGASLLHGAWSGPDVGGSDRTQEFYGGAAYPGTAGGANWPGAGLTAFTFPTSSGAQHNIGIYNNSAGTEICDGGSFVGPFLTTQTVTAIPTGSGLTNFTLDFHDATNGGMLVVWDDEDTTAGGLTPGTSQGNTATVSGLPFAPGLVIGYSISDEPPGQGTGGRGAVGFSVIAPQFQWTALVDGVSSRGAFQSFQRGFCDVVNGTSVHAATVQLTHDGFVATTEEDDVSPAPLVWHAFGHPSISSWLPHIYRRVISGGGRGGLLRGGRLLLEDGSQIVLEDDSGFLRL